MQRYPASHTAALTAFASVALFVEFGLQRGRQRRVLPCLGHLRHCCRSLRVGFRQLQVRLSKKAGRVAVQVQCQGGRERRRPQL